MPLLEHNLARNMKLRNILSKLNNDARSLRMLLHWEITGKIRGEDLNSVEGNRNFKD